MQTIQQIKNSLPASGMNTYGFYAFCHSIKGENHPDTQALKAAYLAEDAANLIKIKAICQAGEYHNLESLVSECRRFDIEPDEFFSAEQRAKFNRTL